MAQSTSVVARPALTLPSWRALAAPHRLALLGITLVAVFCDFWMLGQNGFGNLYYAATVKSMGSNWHAFFFASFDPQGFVTVDKPPVGFWLQVVSTKIFGFTPFAVFLPQALAGVLSVALLYWLVRRSFGRVAGLIAAAALAVSPISVVTNRNNTIDSTLMLVLLLAAWAAFRAIESGKARWLLLSGLLVGLGFNIKMLEAYLVVPAFALAYLLGANKPWVKRLADLALSGLAMVALSLSWVLAVDLVPASLRPWVGSTSNNSEVSLAFGYNGVQRLLGMGGLFGGSNRGPGGGPGNGGPRNGGFPGGGRGFPGGTGAGNGQFPGFQGSGGLQGGPGAGGFPQGGPGNGGPGGGHPGGGGTGMFNTGNPGLFRLFTEPLGGQIVWLLPLALIGIIALAAARRFRPREDRQQQSLILWGTWLITMAVFFSVASFFHQYYLSQMAPAIAALTGIGIITMWGQFHLPGWRGWLLPVSLVVTALEQIVIIVSNPTWGMWLIPLILVPTLLAAALLAVIRLRPGIFAALQTSGASMPAANLTRRLGAVAVALGLAALLLTPTVWSVTPALTNTVSDLPVAGATTMFGNAAPASQVNAALINYLEAHQGSATYLVATPSSNAADAIIISTGKPVMALGGFTGSDPILTQAQLQALVANGVVRYFLLSGNDQGGFNPATTTEGATGTVINVGGPNGAQSSAVQWVRQTCAVVNASAWQSSGGATTNASNGQQLYDCSGK